MPSYMYPYYTVFGYKSPPAYLVEKHVYTMVFAPFGQIWVVRKGPRSSF